jgi:hypothetical protein
MTFTETEQLIQKLLKILEDLVGRKSMMGEIK